MSPEDLLKMLDLGGTDLARPTAEAAVVGQELGGDGKCGGVSHAKSPRVKVAGKNPTRLRWQIAWGASLSATERGRTSGPCTGMQASAGRPITEREPTGRSRPSPPRLPVRAVPHRRSGPTDG